MWAGIQQKGWVNIEATHSLESLLNTGGSQWFVTNLVKVSSMILLISNYILTVWLGATAENVYVRFEVLISMLMKTQVNWSVKPH